MAKCHMTDYSMIVLVRDFICGRWNLSFYWCPFRNVSVSTDVVFVELLLKSPFSKSPCCYILHAVLVSANGRSYSAKHVVILLMTILHTLARVFVCRCKCCVRGSQHLSFYYLLIALCIVVGGRAQCGAYQWTSYCSLFLFRYS